MLSLSVKPLISCDTAEMKPSTVALLLVYTSTTYAASLVDQAPPSEGAEYLFPVDGSEIKLDLGTEGNTLHECQNTTVSWTGAFTGRNVTTTISSESEPGQPKRVAAGRADLALLPQLERE